MKKEKSQSTPSSLKVISLFSGCGGLDLGFKEAGYSFSGAFDINKVAVDNYKANVAPDGQVWDLSSGELPSVFESIDVLLAGSPCQGFSTIGKRELKDPRNTLMLATGKIASQLKPKVIIAENVPGALSGKHRKYWDGLEEMLLSQGYSVKTIRLAAEFFGLPQMRKRIFMIAWSTKSTLDVEEFMTNMQKKEKPLRAVLDDIPKGAANHAPRALKKDSMEYAIARRIRQGMKLCDVRAGSASVHTWQIPEVFGETSERQREILTRVMRLRRQVRTRDFGDADPVPVSIITQEFGEGACKELEGLKALGFLRGQADTVDLKHTFNGKYRRLSGDKVSLTVDTNFGNPRYFLHPLEHRGFTVREAARIQGFPDDFVFSGPEREQFRMIGNAVPPPVGYGLAVLAKVLIGGVK